VPLPGYQVPVGTAVDLGVRPRDLMLPGAGASNGAGTIELRGKVYVVEPLGRQVELTVDIGSARVVAVVDRRAVEPDAPVTLFAPLARVLLFDRETGRRLARSPVGAAEVAAKEVSHV
jgi:multiple sugar transport system ATP-binding protein